MYHLVPRWKWSIWDVEKAYQLVPKWDWPNRDVAKTYQLAPKWDWLIWDVKRMYQVMPKKDGPIWDVTKTCHRDLWMPSTCLGFMKVKSLLAWTIYFHINRLFFSVEFFYQARPYITDILTLPGWFFSICIWKHIHKDNQLIFCSILC